MPETNTQPDRGVIAISGDNSFGLILQTVGGGGGFIASATDPITGAIQMYLDEYLDEYLNEVKSETLKEEIDESGFNFVPSVLDGGQSWFSFPVNVAGGSVWDFDSNKDQYGNFGGQIKLTASIGLDTLIQTDVQTVLHSRTPLEYGITVYGMGLSTIGPFQDIYFDQ